MARFPEGADSRQLDLEDVSGGISSRGNSAELVVGILSTSRGLTTPLESGVPRAHAIVEFHSAQIDHVNCSNLLHQPSKFHIGCSPEAANPGCALFLRPSKLIPTCGREPVGGTVRCELRGCACAIALLVRKWLNLRRFRNSGVSGRAKTHVAPSLHAGPPRLSKSPKILVSACGNECS